MESSEKRAGDQGRVAWGTILLTVGLLLVGERFGLVRFHFGGVWPFVLIALGVVKLAEPPDPAAGRRRRPGGWLIFVGVWGLLTEMHVAGLNYGNSWPIIVSGIGVAIVYRALDHDRVCDSKRGNHAV